MRVDDATRHEVFTAFQQLLGPERAAAVMTMLPNVDWDQLVTKEHLDLRLAALEERVTALDPRFDALEHRLREYVENTLRDALGSQTKWIVGVVGTLILAMIGSTAAMVQAILSRVPVLPAG